MTQHCVCNVDEESASFPCRGSTCKHRVPESERIIDAEMLVGAVLQFVFALVLADDKLARIEQKAGIGAPAPTPASAA